MHTSHRRRGQASHMCAPASLPCGSPVSPAGAPVDLQYARWGARLYLGQTSETPAIAGLLHGCAPHPASEPRLQLLFKPEAAPCVSLRLLPSRSLPCTMLEGDSAARRCLVHASNRVPLLRRRLGHLSRRCSRARRTGLASRGCPIRQVHTLFMQSIPMHWCQRDSCGLINRAG